MIDKETQILKFNMLVEELHKQELIRDEYIDKYGKPLKCLFCNSDDLEDVNIHYCPYGREEYDVKCKACGRIIGHWAYGY